MQHKVDIVPIDKRRDALRYMRLLLKLAMVSTYQYNVCIMLESRC